MIVQTLLLVEDNIDDAWLIRRMLEKYLESPFHLIHSSTMRETETLLRERTEDIALILLDLGLPDTKGGQDTFRHMASYTQDVPIVILTGMEDHGLALGLVAEGAADFVNKGLLHDKPELLRDTVEFAIRRHSIKQEMNRKAKKSLAEKDMIISWMSGGYSVHGEDKAENGKKGGQKT